MEDQVHIDYQCNHLTCRYHCYTGSLKLSKEMYEKMKTPTPGIILCRVTDCKLLGARQEFKVLNEKILTTERHIAKALLEEEIKREVEKLEVMQKEHNALEEAQQAKILTLYKKYEPLKQEKDKGDK